MKHYWSLVIISWLCRGSAALIFAAGMLYSVYYQTVGAVLVFLPTALYIYATGELFILLVHVAQATHVSSVALMRLCERQTKPKPKSLDLKRLDERSA